VGKNGAIRHFNGFSWSDSAQGAWSQYDFYSVVPIASNEVYVVGQSRQVGGNGILLYYNGSNWTERTFGAANALRGIWGTAADGIWIAGEGGAILQYSGE
jgi:photosystem II stability/assembly factor-like uncharacterized protein